MGHELTGEVGGVGERRARVLSGRNVAVNPQVPCGVCSACRSGRENVCQDRELVGGTRPGGFGQLVTVPARCLHVLPDGRRPERRGAGRAAGHLRARRSRLRPGRARDRRSCSAPGTIGVLAAQMLRLIGTEWIAVSDVDAGRREGVAGSSTRSSRRIGSEAVDVRPEGVEITVDAAGTTSTRRDRCGFCSRSATALWLGMHDQDSPIPAFDVVAREQRILGSFAYTNPEFARAVELLATGQLRPAISSSVVPLDQSAAAFEALLAGTPTGYLKSIVAPGAAG